MKKYFVKTALRLRIAPEIKIDNIITVLPQGSIVDFVENASQSGWFKVMAVIGNKDLIGYVNSSFLDNIAEGTPDVSTKIQPVHLTLKSGTLGGFRNLENGRAYPLNEVNMPRRTTEADISKKIVQIYSIINFLDVEKSHRYLPGIGVTYCNIYAYDFAYLANTYLPRVWWTGKAISELSKGNQVEVKYGVTVDELNANSLFDWFSSFGDDFGWERFYDIDTFQSEVNQGSVGIIVAQRKDLSRSGHIVGVIPETNENNALRVNGKVTQLLQTQAGVKNKKIFTGQWFLSDNFRSFGFWLHK